MHVKDYLRSDRQIWRARWVIPVSGPPIEQGTIEVESGRIAAVYPACEAPGNPGSKISSGTVEFDLGNTAILPGLVNAHTHLELSDCPAPLHPMVPFTEWIRQLLTHRKTRTVGHSAVSGGQPAGNSPIARGYRELVEAGTGVVGDIVGGDWHPDQCSTDVTLTVAFREFLGLSPERIATTIQQATDFLALGRSGDLASASAPKQVLFALSPHAPYSVHPELLKQLIDLAAEYHSPVAMHLAETKSELDLLAGRGGEFVEFLKRMGVWHSDVFASERTIRDYLIELARAPRGLVVHGNYLTNGDIAFLAEASNLSVVYCPRTHAGFGHSGHPWRELIGRGITVALGTDSRASNPDLSVWGEVCFLRQRFRDVQPATLLEMATIQGARSLGLDQDFGTLGVGKQAAMTLLELPDRDSTDPYSLLFDQSTRLRRFVSAAAAEVQ